MMTTMLPILIVVVVVVVFRNGDNVLFRLGDLKLGVGELLFDNGCCLLGVTGG